MTYLTALQHWELLRGLAASGGHGEACECSALSARPLTPAVGACSSATCSVPWAHGRSAAAVPWGAATAMLQVKLVNLYCLDWWPSAQPLVRLQCKDSTADQ